MRFEEHESFKVELKYLYGNSQQLLPKYKENKCLYAIWDVNSTLPCETNRGASHFNFRSLPKEA